MSNNIIGFLNTDGVLYSCCSYGHVSKADEIVESLGIKACRSYELSEDVLLKRGWICIRVSDVYKSMCDYEGKVLYITTKQQEFFENHKKDFNNRQLACIERLIKDFGILYKYRNSVGGA